MFFIDKCQHVVIKGLNSASLHFEFQFFTILYQLQYTLLDHVSELMAGFSNSGSGGGTEVEICGRSG